MRTRVSATPALLAAALLFSGCCGCVRATPQITAPTGAITRDAAIAAAKRQAPPSSTDPTVGWAVVRPNPLSSDTTNQLVWQVNLLGPFAAPTCSPGIFDQIPVQSDQPCEIEGWLQAVIDIYTGQLLGWIPSD